VETAYLSLTRGDGGQNLIGDELGPELGMIRTEELLAARRIDGGRQFFTRAYDFASRRRSLKPSVSGPRTRFSKTWWRSCAPIARTSSSRSGAARRATDMGSISTRAWWRARCSTRRRTPCAFHRPSSADFLPGRR